MPKVLRVLETCIHVDDVERSARFYEKLLSFPRMDSNERFCVFDAGGGSVLILSVGAARVSRLRHQEG